MDITVEKFWKIIDECNAALRGNKIHIPSNLPAEAFEDTTFMELLDNRITLLPVVELFQFHRTLNFYIDLARTDALHHACCACEKLSVNYNGFVPEDDFDNFIAWLIAQGREVYTAVLKDPQQLSEVIVSSDDHSLEELLYIANNIYCEDFSANMIGVENLYEMEQLFPLTEEQKAALSALVM